jgi:hypothetical protein
VTHILNIGYVGGGTSTEVNTWGIRSRVTVKLAAAAAATAATLLQP